MKYDISKEYGLYVHMHPPLTKAILPSVNFLLGLLPKSGLKGLDVKKLSLPSTDGEGIDALLISPKDAGDNAPCLVYFHGGGFVMEAAPSHYRLTAEYARRAHCRVLFVKYRLAPGYVYPVQVNDCFCAYKWALENADAIGTDVRRIAVGGDSAGGCLAAAVCIMARDSGVKPPCFQMLVYPVLDKRMETESMRIYTDTPMWNARLNKKMWEWYLQGLTDGISYASPAEADLRDLPDAYIETAEFDCLRDEGREYAEALIKAGTAVRLNMTRGTMHGYDTVKKSPTVRESVAARVDALLRAFEKQGSNE